MMRTRAEGIAFAREWIGTPYVKEAMVKGAGCDCATLIGAYLIALGVASDIRTPHYSHDWFCHTKSELYFDNLSLYATLRWTGRCLGTPPTQPGDIALFRVAQSPVFNHGCIITAWPRALHCFDVGVHELRPGLHPLTAHAEMAIFDPWGLSQAQ